jgi:hypothetical protein
MSYHHVNVYGMSFNKNETPIKNSRRRFMACHLIRVKHLLRIAEDDARKTCVGTRALSRFIKVTTIVCVPKYYATRFRGVVGYHVSLTH